MKKNADIIGFSAIFMITFGITYLDFDNLNFGDNLKPYMFIIIGFIIFIFSIYKKRT